MVAVVGIIVAVLFGTGGIWIGIRQTNVAKEQTRIANEQTRIANELRAREEERDREETEWQRKQEAVANQLVKMSPGLMVDGLNPGAMTGLYTTIFPDRRTRLAVENYIVQVAGNGTQFVVRKPTPHELRSENFRTVVTTTAAQLADFAQKHPDIYAKVFER